MSRQSSTTYASGESAHRERYGEGFADSGGSQSNGASSSAATRDVSSLVAELKEYAGHFAAAKVDAVKASVRNIVIYAVLGVLGLFVGSTIIITGTVLLLTGISNGIGAIFPPRLHFIGPLVVGLIVLGGLAGAALFILKKFGSSSKKQTIDKYESRQAAQRAQFGRDVEHVD